MTSPRGTVLLLLLVLALVAGTMGMMVWSPAPGILPSGGSVASTPSLGSAAELAAESPSPEFRLDLPGDRRARDEVVPPVDVAATIPPELEAHFEKRYRGFADDALAIAHQKLCKTLFVRADQVLRERLKAGVFRTARAGSAKRIGAKPGEAFSTRTVVRPDGTAEASLTRTVLRPDGTADLEIAEIDVAQHESTRDLYLEIAWLAARLPKKASKAGG
jgi:hypothetical protein